MNRPPVLDLKPYFLTLNDLAGPIDWAAFFGNENPVELDVGCGRGLFLFTASTSKPTVNYLGLELDYHEGRRAAQRLWKRSQPNARVLGGDAADRPHENHPAEIGRRRARLFPRSVVEAATQTPTALYRRVRRPDGGSPQAGRLVSFLDRCRGVLRRDPCADGSSRGFSAAHSRPRRPPPLTISTTERALSARNANSARRFIEDCGRRCDDLRRHSNSAMLAVNPCT